MKYYAGIGSRKTPPEILTVMREYAAILAKRGYTLRSGGASGADTAFELGAGPKDIYLPWRGFNGHRHGIVVGDDERLRGISARYHPAWAKLSDPLSETFSDAVCRLHTRNAAQILGHTEPVVLSDFVLCWTPRARAGGGTGQAIRIAKAYGVPVYDLADAHNSFERDWLG